MKLQTLFESAGDVWVIVLDLNDGQFSDDDVFENMEIFGSEPACVARIFEHFEKAFFDAGEEDNVDELRKLQKRNNTVEKAISLIGMFEALDHLSDVLMVKKKRIS